MQKSDRDRIKFYSVHDMSCSYNAKKSEAILRVDVANFDGDSNDILEFYNIKKIIDHEFFLTEWSEDEVLFFRSQVEKYGNIIGKFISNLNNSNIINIHSEVFWEYKSDFWELINNQSAYKRISTNTLQALLKIEPHLIYTLLHHKKIVGHYDSELQSYILTYPKSAEIILSNHQAIDSFNNKKYFLPASLTNEDKEAVLLKYLESDKVNYNYLSLIQNVRNQKSLRISDSTRLKAKRLQEQKIEHYFSNNQGIYCSVGVRFLEQAKEIKDVSQETDDTTIFSYSTDYIKKNSAPYSLLHHFKYLFEYVDDQNRVNLVSKRNQMGVLEFMVGAHAESEYRTGIIFSVLQMTSHSQIAGYSKILSQLDISLEKLFATIFTHVFQEFYEFADNADFSYSTAETYFEKVRFLAPEFESILKQFKLFVEKNEIDFELLQISSAPVAIKDIPSLNERKYIYFNHDNNDATIISRLLFSDQTLLAYVEPFKEKNYRSFFELLKSEEKILFNNYEEHQKIKINYLIEHDFISVSKDGFIDVKNPVRVLILNDLYENEVVSFYHYKIEFQEEVIQMESQEIVYFEGSLFSKPEQAYFNYHLNKSEFTNGHDLRNSYLHGTQGRAHEVEKHEFAYFTYLKLLALVLLKIDDDLFINKTINSNIGT